MLAEAEEGGDRRALIVRGAPSCRNKAARVTVLLSLSNGADVVDSQIASILDQTWPRVRLIVRDEGSADGTWERLRAWRKDPRVLPIRGYGARARWLRMLGLVDARTEIVAFAEQGDIWRPERIERGLKAFCAAPPGQPGLYFSRALRVDDKFIVQSATPLWPRPPDFGNALVENIIAGGTILLNRAAIALIQSAGAPYGVTQDEWWCYLVVSAFGDVIFDPRPSVLMTAPERRPFAACPADPLPGIIMQARSFSRHFGAHPALSAAHRELASTLAMGSEGGVRALAVNRRVRRQFAWDDLRLRLRMLARPWPVRRPTPVSAARVIAPPSHSTAWDL